MTQFIISLEDDDVDKKTQNDPRAQIVRRQENWRRIWVDIKVPKGQKFNNVKVKFWNAGGSKEIWIDDLTC